MNIIEYLRHEIRSMHTSLRRNIAWAREMADVKIDEKVPSAVWLDEEAVTPLKLGVISESIHPSDTERLLNEYRLAKYAERATFHRYTPDAEKTVMRWPAPRRVAVAAA